MKPFRRPSYLEYAGLPTPSPSITYDQKAWARAILARSDHRRLLGCCDFWGALSGCRTHTVLPLCTRLRAQSGVAASHHRSGRASMTGYLRCSTVSGYRDRLCRRRLQPRPDLPVHAEDKLLGFILSAHHCATCVLPILHARQTRLHFCDTPATLRR